jgi:hypothetical protein
MILTWDQSLPTPQKTTAKSRRRGTLLFIGLLTLLNAPFDWFSLGLMRALLRRGLELGGWWPYALALVDAGLAAVIIAALALTLVVGVQTFDALAVYGGGASVLPLEPLFSGIAAHPTAPEYWWLYALLLSTMIPSLVNLVIGGTSLVRGLPGVPSILLRFMPDERDERGQRIRDLPWRALAASPSAPGTGSSDPSRSSGESTAKPTFVAKASSQAGRLPPVRA